MVEKITALVFSVLLFIIMVVWSFDSPTVENIVAAVFSAISVISIIISIVRKDYVLIVDDASKGKRKIDNGIKMSNEIAPYIKEKDGKIYLKIKQ